MLYLSLFKEEVLGEAGSMAEDFETREIIKKVNLILDQSADDILSVINQEVSKDQ